MDFAFLPGVGSADASLRVEAERVTSNREASLVWLLEQVHQLLVASFSEANSSTSHHLRLEES